MLTTVIHLSAKDQLLLENSSAFRKLNLAVTRKIEQDDDVGRGLGE